MILIDPVKYPNCAKGNQYAHDVLSGKITACVYVKGACERYLRDIENKSADFYMDWDIAEKYLRVVQQFEHVIGTWATKNIVYEPWQCFNWMNIMGFKSKKTKFRRFRVTHLEVSRGNSKSCMASQAVLYFLALDENLNGNKISTVATKKDQARIVLDSARAMAEKNKSYLSHTGVKVLAHIMKHKKSNSEARALSSEKNGLDGLQDVLAVCDELHAMDRKVFETITSGMSKRGDSLTLCITTAGDNTHSVGHSQSAYAKKVCLGDVEDDSFFACVYTLDEGDYWADSSVWIKANPNLGISVNHDDLRAKVKKALEIPADIPNLKIKHFNVWDSEAHAFFDLKSWDDCADKTLKLEDFEGKSCRLALDLASHIDITSEVVLFRETPEGEDEPIYTLFDKSYIPEDTIKGNKNAKYDNWVEQGYLIKTPGAAINYGKIQDGVKSSAKKFHVIECMYDPWNATETAQDLSETVEMVKISMNVANLSEPMKKMDTFIRKKRFRHNGSPLLRWCIGNVVAKRDHNDNVFPRKEHERLKIDPIVAAIMAMAGWTQDTDGDSIYETSGVRYI